MKNLGSHTWLVGAENPAIESPLGIYIKTLVNNGDFQPTSLVVQ